MKIIHFCLSNFYVDHYSYQENELVAQHVLDGHEVTVVASTETFGPSRDLIYLKPSHYIGSDGAAVVRLPYRNFGIPLLTRKVRAYPGVWDLLTTLKPDVILFHGTAGWELVTVSRYKALNPAVRFFIDSHEDETNSARNFFSKWGLHFLFYRPILKYSLKFAEKILCVNVASMDFLRHFYQIDDSCLEFFPLGGKIIESSEYESIRTSERSRLGLDEGDLLFVQSGKFDLSKKLIESLRGFATIERPFVRLVLAGHLHDEIREVALALIANDNRVQFVGWKTADELRALLCAADVYVQPGTQSATMQMSLCCGCAVILDDVPSHYPYVSDNGWLVNSEASLADAFQDAARSSSQLSEMRRASFIVANRLLDYRRLAARLYS